MKSNTTNKTPYIIITVALVIAIGMIFSDSSQKNQTSSNTVNKKVAEVTVPNTEIKDGVQYITITARGGYSPRMSTAKAGIPTKLVVKTDGTYDCSASLVIKALNYRNMLPNTGETVIDAGTLKQGDILQGVCGMGMYSFIVTFM